MDERDVLVGGWSGDQGGCLSDLGGVSILVLRVYYDVYYSCLIHYMYYERIRVYYRYRNLIHCVSMYYGVLDLEILIPYNTPLCAVVIHVSHADVPTYCEDADEDGLTVVGSFRMLASQIYRFVPPS